MEIVLILGVSRVTKREQFNKVRAMPGQQAAGIAEIAKEIGLTR